jgi:hypothetical protein
MAVTSAGTYRSVTRGFQERRGLRVCIEESSAEATRLPDLVHGLRHFPIMKTNCLILAANLMRALSMCSKEVQDAWYQARLVMQKYRAG